MKRQCIVCGVEFKLLNTRIYCSKICKRTRVNEQRRKIKVSKCCTMCDTVFVTADHRKTCSEVCRNKLEAQRLRESRASDPERFKNYEKKKRQNMTQSQKNRASQTRRTWARANLASRREARNRYYARLSTALRILKTFGLDKELLP